MANRKIYRAAVTLLVGIMMLTVTAGAVEEADVQNAIAASSREKVAGNLFIWFLCAVGFLKVSQKIDSFMSALGINVGRTGGSMLSELMIAGKAIAGVAGAAGHAVTNSFHRNHASNQQAAGQAYVNDQLGHGMIGMSQQGAANAAVASVTGRGTGIKTAVAGGLYQSSLQKSGQFSTDVIRSVATGSISQMGMMTGTEAAEALTSYMGYSMAEGAADEESSFENNEAGNFDRVVSGGNQASDLREGSSGMNAESTVGADRITLNGGSAGIMAGTAESTGTSNPITEKNAIPSAPAFSSIEIGGGRISGYETPAGSNESTQFTMYNATQYMEPNGPYETVKTVDGEKWYKQYAQPTVEKTPVEVSGKGIKYDEKIVMKMPAVPKRKDKI